MIVYHATNAGAGKRPERAGKTGGQEGRNHGEQEDVPGRMTSGKNEAGWSAPADFFVCPGFLYTDCLSMIEQ